MWQTQPLPGRCTSDRPGPSPSLQSLAMLKDGFRTDRGSHSDLWSSSSSLESSGFPLPKQYLDVSSQTDISGSVSRQGLQLGPQVATYGRPPLLTVAAFLVTCRAGWYLWVGLAAHLVPGAPCLTDFLAPGDVTRWHRRGQPGGSPSPSHGW